MAFVIRKCLRSLYVLALLVYIISPLDLIPDAIPIIGWIDDAIAILFLILYITCLYYSFIRLRQ
jgi:Uncharacterized conserved protein